MVFQPISTLFLPVAKALSPASNVIVVVILIPLEVELGAPPIYISSIGMRGYDQSRENEESLWFKDLQGLFRWEK